MYSPKRRFRLFRSPAFNPPSPFTPTNLTGLNLWLDATDTTTMTFSSGSNIVQWRDKSGEINHATGNNSPVKTPNSINGVQAVVFSTNQYFRGPVSVTGSNVTTFAVAQTTRAQPNTGVDQRLVSLASDGTDYGGQDVLIALFNQESSSTISTYRATDTTVGASAITANTPFQAVSRYNGTTGALWKDGTAGTSSASVGTFAVTKYGIGNQANAASEYWIGSIGEILLYTTALSDADRQKVEGYLAWKWGLQSSLPANHPYKSAPPTG
jgi:hypothetical protein